MEWHIFTSRREYLGCLNHTLMFLHNHPKQQIEYRKCFSAAQSGSQFWGLHCGLWNLNFRACVPVKHKKIGKPCATLCNLVQPWNSLALFDIVKDGKHVSIICHCAWQTPGETRRDEMRRDETRPDQTCSSSSNNTATATATTAGNRVVIWCWCWCWSRCCLRQKHRPTWACRLN